MKTAIVNLKAVAATKPRDATSKTTLRQGNQKIDRLTPALVDVTAGDLAEACAAVTQPSEVVQVLARAVAGMNQNRIVAIQVTDLYHLLEACGETPGG